MYLPLRLRTVWLLGVTACCVCAVAQQAIAAEVGTVKASTFQFDSPKAAYEAAKAAYEKRDWQTFIKCHDDDAQTAYSSISLLSALGTLFLLEGEEQETKFQAVAAICEKHEMKPLLTFIGQLGMFGKINFTNLTKKQYDKISNYLRGVKDKPAFVADIQSFVGQGTDGSRFIRFPLYQAELQRIEVEGETAEAMLISDDDQPLTVTFHKRNGGWLVSLQKIEN